MRHLSEDDYNFLWGILVCGGILAFTALLCWAGTRETRDALAKGYSQQPVIIQCNDGSRRTQIIWVAPNAVIETPKETK